MAKADIDVKIVLALTEDEAVVLRDILANIAGFPGTRRELANNIAEALDAIGLEFDGETDDLDGEITFHHTEG